ncbi:glycoside hydrolase family 6 protein [Actinoplanes sp. RD1]|uniref:glycoside hydrolase family 6 protein n=1 Tax=Actinoplanes sp. RD1 TaxID=3064538 RepID=UPI00274054A6|nr:glycoside hydrolase family 6 protein [Actinoplanes sp. RD1]
MRVGPRYVLAAAAVLAVALGVGLVAFTRDDELGSVAVTLPSAPPSPSSPALSPSPTSSPGPSGSGPSGDAQTSSANAAIPLYVDPSGAAAQQVRDYQAAGQAENAALIRKIADRPVATWFADSSPGGAGRARALVTAAARAGKVPVLTLYNIPHRDCSGQSAGGAASAAEYKAWIDGMAGALTGRAIVILEPDAMPHAVEDCLDDAGRAERYQLLGYAIDRLRAAHSGVSVYLDAGNPSWITDTGRLAEALRAAGVERAAGFSLNVANFETTEANIRYGTELSGHLNGARFVIDTSRNGNGPADRGPDGDEHWCNPAGRKLGDLPTTSTGVALADAYLWIKRPGESDGACGDGAPAAGQWFADYALALAG